MGTQLQSISLEEIHFIFNCDQYHLRIFIFNMSCRSRSELLKSKLGKRSIEKKKTFSFGHCPNKGGGGLTMPEFFGPFSRSAFLVNKKNLFLQKCQCIELLTVF